MRLLRRPSTGSLAMTEKKSPALSGGPFVKGAECEHKKTAD